MSTTTSTSEAQEASPVRRVTCPRCQAGKGEACHTSGGAPAESSHTARWDHAKTRFRTEEMVFELREDDPRFNLSKGDLLACVAYPLDAKVTVLRRISDSYDPECNQYIAAVRFVAFANEYTP